MPRTDSTRYIDTLTGPRRYTELAPDLARAVEAVCARLAQAEPSTLVVTPDWWCRLHRDAFGRFVAWAGKLRDRNVQIGDHEAPAFHEVPVMLRNYCGDLEARLSSYTEPLPDQRLIADLAFAEALHFWKYYDLVDRRIVDNRYIIATLISCERDTPRVVGDYDVFAVQEKIIEDILRSHEERQAMEEAPKTVDPLQQTVVTTIQGFMNRPEIKRQDALAAIRFLSKPTMSVVVKELRSAYRRFQSSADVKELLATVLTLSERYGATELQSDRIRRRLRREDLRLICFDHLCS